jgi:acetyl-CoA carboxylase biotin carboxyl carrier protein
LVETPATATWLDALRQVVDVVRGSDVAELELGNGAFSVRVRRDVAALRLDAGPSATASRAADELDAQLHAIVAPFTGIFYRSPTPTAGSYVNEGDWVDTDAVIGLVETMKIFNEIKTDVAGRVVRFAADNGQLVHTGEPLLLLKQGERAAADAEPHL